MINSRRKFSFYPRNFFLQTKLAQNIFATGGICGKCLLWRFASAITWGNFFFRGKSTAHLIDSGTWIPALGVNLTDVIFPHVAHGFRGINLPIATYHVSNERESFFRWWRSHKDRIFFQNPPWQIITLTNSGEKEYGGLIFDVVKYLAKKLNFTYSVLSPANNRTIKFTQNETQVDMVSLCNIIFLFHNTKKLSCNYSKFLDAKNLTKIDKWLVSIVWYHLFLYV